MREWEELWHTSPLAHPFNSPQWFRACIHTFEYQETHIVAVRQEGRLVALLPLVRTSRFGVETFAFPGSTHTDMSCMLLAEHDRELMRMIVAHLARTVPFYIQELSGELKDMLTDSTNTLTIRKSSENPFLPVGHDPFRYVPKRELDKIIRKAKRYEKILSFHTFWGDTGGLSIAFDIDSRSTKRREGKESFSGPQSREFFINLALEFREMFRIDAVYHDDTPIVYSIGFIHGNKYFALNTAYDGAYKHFIPGKMMLYYLLKNLMYDDVRLVHFSRGVNDLKRQFTPHSYPQYDVYYSKQPWKQLWWSFTNASVEAIVNSEPIYKAYKKVRMSARLR